MLLRNVSQGAPPLGLAPCIEWQKLDMWHMFSQGMDVADDLCLPLGLACLVYVVQFPHVVQHRCPPMHRAVGVGLDGFVWLCCLLQPRCFAMSSESMPLIHWDVIGEAKEMLICGDPPATLHC